MPEYEHRIIVACAQISAYNPAYHPVKGEEKEVMDDQKEDEPSPALQRALAEAKKLEEANLRSHFGPRLMIRFSLMY